MGRWYGGPGQTIVWNVKLSHFSAGRVNNHYQPSLPPSLPPLQSSQEREVRSSLLKWIWRVQCCPLGVKNMMMREKTVWESLVTGLWPVCRLDNWLWQPGLVWIFPGDGDQLFPAWETILVTHSTPTHSRASWHEPGRGMADWWSHQTSSAISHLHISTSPPQSWH